MDAGTAKAREVCGKYLRAETLLPLEEKAAEEAAQASQQEDEREALQAKIQALTRHLDKMYMDTLAGILDDADFQRIYLRIKAERGRWSSG